MSTATAQGVGPQGVQQSVSEDEDASQHLHQENKSIARGRDEGIDPSNIIEGPRTRHSRHAFATIDDDDPQELLKAFGYALYTENSVRRHRDDVPPDKKVATLAARTARMLFSLVAAYELDLT
ncbi:hypothetical protein N7535_007430 [Penicillium sp. DV-2018c]|nr:hypothetical protein N7461_003458 [Penicillium sp. DV-2018c]KAJ5565792.1 hypothetical protein N7535_007430 [Penicillium sp. DV-2018c]